MDTVLLIKDEIGNALYDADLVDMCVDYGSTHTLETGYYKMDNSDGDFSQRVTEDAACTNSAELVGDFDGDGASDVFSYDRDGPDSLDLASGDSIAYSIGGLYKPLVGDFNGDGISDIFLYRPGNKNDYLWLQGFFFIKMFL